MGVAGIETLSIKRQTIKHTHKNKDKTQKQYPTTTKKGQAYIHIYIHP